MFYVERSHRTENLLQGLAERLMSPRPDPLSPSFVVVQGQGMERWIAQAVAREYGVCANTEFLFPRHLLEKVFALSEAASGAEIPTLNPGWQPDQLLWSVARRIASSRGAPELAPLARQLESADRSWRLVQLASQIASRFDDYITYRPDWVTRWAKQDPRDRSTSLGSDESWQAWLFRGVLEDLGPGHFADRAIRFMEFAQNDPSETWVAAVESNFESAIEVFAVSTLPPLYLAVFDALARIVDVRLSVLSPSRHYWADLWSEIRADSEAADVIDKEDAEALFPTQGTRGPGPMACFLAGLGRLGSDFQRSLEQASTYSEGESDRFEESIPVAEEEEPSLLRRVQARFLDLDFGAAEAAEEGGERSSRWVSRSDRSIRVHLCPGPKRELEVVEASLREAFDLDPTLTPEDVIVMAPDIDALVPLIDAVFAGGGGNQAARIPYRIADRGTLRRSPVAEAFVALLELLSGRAGRNEVLDWISFEPVREKLGLDVEGVDRLGDWAVRAGIRFGLDERHREALSLEKSRRHTWAGGIDRLVIGHALGASGELVRGLSPEPLGPLFDPSLLGALGELECVLSKARWESSEFRSVSDWSSWLLRLLEATLDHREDNAHEHDLLRSAIQGLASAAENASFEERIPLAAMRERFQAAIETSSPAQGFVSGGVTFCELVPLRAIPFRVIAIVGLSDANFPRRRPAASYDLMARNPRSGDRNSRIDDRYLFLEALLSARDQWILTVPSRDLRDGSDQPISVVVSELLDALDASFDPETSGADQRLRDRIVVEHPIHSFSRRYFESRGDSRLVGLDSEAFEGAVARRAAIRAGGGEARRFLRILEPAPAEATDRHLRLDDLIERVLRSTRVFARERLGMRLPRPERSIGDFDPVSIGALDQYGLGAALLADLRAGSNETAMLQRLAASPRLPAGEPGRLAARSLEGEVVSTFEIAKSRIGNGPFVEHPFDLRLESSESRQTARVSGIVRNVTAEGPLRIEFARFGGRSELEFWIQHLAVCVLADEGADLHARSLFVSRSESKSKGDRVSIFSYVTNAKEELARLFEWAWSVERAPLPFFPRTSRVFATRRADGKEEQAWRDAYQKFHGGDSGPFSFPESEEDLEYARIWEGLGPLESKGDIPTQFRFDSLAERFFEAFFAAREVHEK